MSLNVCIFHKNDVNNKHEYVYEHLLALGIHVRIRFKRMLNEASLFLLDKIAFESAI